MDRGRRRVGGGRGVVGVGVGVGVALIAVAIAGCGGGRARGGGGVGMGDGELAVAASVDGPGLAYAVAIVAADDGGDGDGGDARVVSVELETEFALVVRRLTADGWDGTARRLPLGPADWDVGDLAIDRAGRVAYAAVADGSVREIELGRSGEVPRERRRFRLGAAVTAVALGDGDRVMLSGSADGVVCARRVADGALLQCVHAHGAAVTALDVGGRRVVSAAADGEVAVMGLPGLAIERRLRAGGRVGAVAVAPDGGAVALGVGGGGGTAIVEVVGLDQVAARGMRLRGHRGVVDALAWTPDGRRLLSGGRDGVLRLWDAGGDGRLVAQRAMDCERIRAIGVAADGRRAVVGAWAVRKGEERVVVVDLGE